MKVIDLVNKDSYRAYVIYLTYLLKFKTDLIKKLFF